MADNRKRILIIEDDKMIGSMYKMRFEQEDFMVLTADNGVQGLDLAIKKELDLILLDIIMPQLDGFSVLQQLKKNKKTKNIPIIMLTNLGTDEDKSKGKRLGATDYIVKASLTPAQVSELIKKYLK